MGVTAGPDSNPGAATGGPRVRNHLAFAVVTTAFFFTPFGLVALMHSNRVGRRLGAGDLEGALSASRKARAWSWAALILGLIVYPILFAILWYQIRQVVPELRRAFSDL